MVGGSRVRGASPTGTMKWGTATNTRDYHTAAQTHKWTVLVEGREEFTGHDIHDSRFPGTLHPILVGGDTEKRKEEKDKGANIGLQVPGKMRNRSITHSQRANKYEQTLPC